MSVGQTPGLETISNNGFDRNIDVKYKSLDVGFTAGGSWQAFDNNDHGADDDYTFDRISNWAFNTYKAPLD